VVNISFGGNIYWGKRERYTFGGNGYWWKRERHTFGGNGYMHYTP